MIEEYRRKTNIGVSSGIVAQVLGYFLTFSQVGIIMWIGALLAWGGFLLVMWGLFNYAKGKGYSGLWGLLGLLSVFGLAILAFFPDKKKGV
ncbi:MAG TPA: hypothetical protein PLA52_06705 [Candidatus Omnitrophota bacterium]|nr:hypothetical protein [Candidatus Omnitrophota bacterium]